MARPDLLELRPAWGERASGATRLLLAPLSDDASERLVTNLLGTSELPADVRRRITAVTEGNPLFVEEVVAMLVDEGLSQDGSPISLPPTIQALLGARLDRLVREDRAVLERGSVEGKVFHRGAVVELSPADERPQVEERLSRLLEREFLEPGRPGFVGERAYRFHHQLLRDVAYESLPKAAAFGAARALRRLARSEGRQSCRGVRRDSRPPSAAGLHVQIRPRSGRRAWPSARSSGGEPSRQRRLTCLRPRRRFGHTNVARPLPDAAAEGQRFPGGTGAEARRCTFRARGVQEATAEPYVAALLLAPAARSHLGDEGERRQAGAALRCLRQGDTRPAGLGRQARRSRVGPEGVSARWRRAAPATVAAPAAGELDDVRGSERPRRPRRRARSRAAGPA